MKVYVFDCPSHAGKWIYKGYQNAWAALGYEMVPIPQNKTIDLLGLDMSVVDKSEEYMIMIPDSSLDISNIEIIEKSHKAFIYSQPNTFPRPWGMHNNFICLAPEKMISYLNEMEHVHLWSWLDSDEYHTKWKKVNTIPLAFDTIDYRYDKQDKYSSYDVCYVGGWANNGFNEKREIMIKHFNAFRNSGLKCGIFINRNLTHQQETQLLSSSKVSLNIHDQYQRVLGLDTNERTFKSLGLNGILVSDEVTQLQRIFPQLNLSSHPEEMVSIVKETLSLPLKQLEEIRHSNRELVAREHSYINRVKQLLEL